MRIICQCLHGHWSAWLEEHPDTAFGGDEAAIAITRLVEATPGLELKNLNRDDEASTDVRFVLVVDAACPDCDGSGRYVGLNETGVCGTCGGSGRVGH